MAPQSVYTLHDLQTHIDQRFLQASRHITDVNNYFFLHNTRNQLVTTATSNDRLQLTMWTTSFSGVQAMVESKSNTVRYYIGGREVHLVSSDYPLSSMFAIDLHEAPFRYIAPHNWTQCKTGEKTLLRMETRERVSLLVKFAFLLTGRINQIKSNDERDLLLEFEKICISVEEGLQADEIREKNIAHRRRELDELLDDSETAGDIEFDTPEKTNTLEAGLSGHVSASGSKRVASSDDENPEIIFERNDANTNKRHKLSNLLSVTAPATSDSALTSVEVTDRAEKMGTLLDAVAEHHKKELLEARAQEKQAYSQQIGTTKRLLETKVQEETASRKEIEMLKNQLSEQKAEADEWKAKFQKLDARVQNFVKGE